MSKFLAKEPPRSKYRLLGLIGQGQFGRVYCAIHRKTGRLVALKELAHDRFSTHKFLRELRFLLSFQHENIVTCQALEHTSTGRYLVMDYCEGGTLRNLLDEGIQLHPTQGLQIILQVLAGLEHAHQRGIVHCDIKPENILLNVTANGWTARISDFGIARLSQEMTADVFSNTGSPAYMAPERFYGQYSLASDLYAVGILLFELLTGYRPFSGPPAELMSAHLNRLAQIPETLPEDFRAILAKALQKLPARRFHSATEMLQMLQAAYDRAQHELSQGWPDGAVLRPVEGSPPQPFSYEYQEALPSPINQLVGSTAQWVRSHLPENPTRIQDGKDAPPPPAEQAIDTCPFFRVFGSRVGYQLYAEPDPQSQAKPANLALLDASEQLSPLAFTQFPFHVVRLPDAIAHLAVYPQGCFATTRQTIYLLPPELFQAGIEQHGQRSLQHSRKGDRLILHAVPQLLAEFDQEILTTVSSTGTWLAAITCPRDRTTSHLTIWNVRNRPCPKPDLVKEVEPCFQMTAIDRSHIALFSHKTDRSSACINGVIITIYTRRGNYLGKLKLPIPLRSIYSTPTPYRLLAIEPNYPKSILLVDLKPLRIQRIGLPIKPKLVAATAWGYLLTNAEGHIVVLDHYGQLLGQVDGPTSPTAIAPLANDKILLATWDTTQGSLYIIDLQTLGLDLLF